MGGKRSRRGTDITLYDYNVGNIHSIRKALELAGAKVKVVTDVDSILEAKAIVFPGVGEFGAVMRTIGKRRNQVGRKLGTGVPTLGICIGFQIMFEGSDEARNKGISFMKGQVRRLSNVRLPHMGWNLVSLRGSKGRSRTDPLLKGLPKEAHFYFAHSFAPVPKGGNRLGTTEYGKAFPSIMRKGNTYGTQFHPEKSGKVGLRLISNFVRFAGEV